MRLQCICLTIKPPIYSMNAHNNPHKDLESISQHKNASKVYYLIYRHTGLFLKIKHIPTMVSFKTNMIFILPNTPLLSCCPKYTSKNYSPCKNMTIQKRTPLAIWISSLCFLAWIDLHSSPSWLYPFPCSPINMGCNSSHPPSFKGLIIGFRNTQ